MKKFILAKLLIFTVLPFWSCKKKGPSQTDDKPQTEAKKNPPALLMERDPWPLPYWTAKAKINLNHPGMNVSFSMTLRAEKDKQIWFSAQAFGLLEVARCLITQDSMKVWDKFNNRCMLGSHKKIEEFLPVSLGISQLQYFLMGRVFWDSLSFGIKDQRADSLLYKGQNGPFGFEAKVWQKYLLHTARAWDETSKSGLQLVNQNFKQSGNSLIPMNKDLKSSEWKNGKEEKSEVQIEFTKFEFTANKPVFELELPQDCSKENLDK
jgi:hypothetical protein